MTEKDLARVLHEAAHSVHMSELLQAAILGQTNGGKPVKKKLTLSAVLMAALIVIMVSAAAAEALGFGLLDFMNYRHRGQTADVLTEHVQPVQTGRVELDGVVFTAVDAVCDCGSVMVTVEARARDEKTLLLTEYADETDWIGILGGEYEELPGDMSIGRYAEENGLRLLNVELMNASECPGSDEPDFGIETTSGDHHRESGHVLHLMMSCTLTSPAEGKLDFKVYPMTYGMNSDDYHVGEPLVMQLNVLPRLWEAVYEAPTDGARQTFGDADISVERIRVYGTALRTYYEVVSRVGDESVSDMSAVLHAWPQYEVLRADGTRFPRSFEGSGSMTVIDSTHLEHRGEFGAINAAPEAITLRCHSELQPDGGETLVFPLHVQ